MIRTLTKLALCAPLLVLASCAGYRLGGAKPASLTNVRNIAVPMFANDTQHPRASALATTSVINTLVRDGTYRISKADKADAVLEGRLAHIGYQQIRGTRLDSAYPEELANRIAIEWVLRDAKNPSLVLAGGRAEGTSQLFVPANLQTARNNALSEALDRASETLVSSIANGY